MPRTRGNTKFPQHAKRDVPRAADDELSGPRTIAGDLLSGMPDHVTDTSELACNMREQHKATACRQSVSTSQHDYQGMMPYGCTYNHGADTAVAEDKKGDQLMKAYA